MGKPSRLDLDDGVEWGGPFAENAQRCANQGPKNRFPQTLLTREFSVSAAPYPPQTANGHRNMDFSSQTANGHRNMASRFSHFFVKFTETVDFGTVLGVLFEPKSGPLSGSPFHPVP